MATFLRPAPRRPHHDGEAVQVRDAGRRNLEEEGVVGA